MLGECSTRCHHEMWHVECHDIRTCKMWALEEGTSIFRRMPEGVQPDSITFVGVLNVCANVVAIEEGSCAH
jgi:hypothetical protein